MASSRKSSRSRTASGLAAHVARSIGVFLKPSTRIVIGLSGGADSVALLDCLHDLSRQRRFRLAALHVNHQLSPNAARWEAFCRKLCRMRGMAFRSVKVSVSRGPELESAARAARYRVFAGEDCDYIALAHHRDDQVETLLLQLLRGAGVKGAAGMPVLRKVQDTRHKAQGGRRGTQGAPDILRPLLDVTRAEILEYVKARGLKWVEDESNRDTRLRRNFLRNDILPALERRFPSYRVTLARSVAHFAEAARVLDEVAAGDAAGALSADSLAVDALRRLTPARARNLLRYFLSTRGLAAPGADRLEEAMRQSLSARVDARVSIGLGDARLMRYRGRLYVVPGNGDMRAFAVRWRGEPRIALPQARSVVTFSRGRDGGIAISRLGGAVLTIRSRTGGERLQPDCRRPRRSLKNLLQESGVPPWSRERVPLLCCGGSLVWAGGIGVDCAFQARGQEPAWTVKWTALD